MSVNFWPIQTSFFSITLTIATLAMKCLRAGDQAKREDAIGRSPVFASAGRVGQLEMTEIDAAVIASWLVS